MNLLRAGKKSFYLLVKLMSWRTNLRSSTPAAKKGLDNYLKLFDYCENSIYTHDIGKILVCPICYTFSWAFQTQNPLNKRIKRAKKKFFYFFFKYANCKATLLSQFWWSVVDKCWPKTTEKIRKLILFIFYHPLFFIYYPLSITLAGTSRSYYTH